MKVTWNWLLELVDLDKVPTVEEGAAALTALGLEVEGMTSLGAGFAGVVVAEVVAVRPHPGSDKLRLVDVITERGGAATQVVCGAPNVPAPGGRVLWAQPGARLPGGITLATKPVKGIDSPGMLCAEDELGIGDDEAGIVVLAADDRTPLGAPAQIALGVDDWMLEINAPANRADVLGHLGVARELCLRLGGRVVPPPVDDASLVDILAPDLDAAALVSVFVDDPDGCGRYVARVVDGVTVGPSPRKLAQRLRAVGVRPLSNLVDVTNYVMFELGQPLHAFDHATIAGGRIGVRAARDGEQLMTLDGLTRTLTQGDLTIVDGGANGGVPVALAGVMGGAATEVHAGTTRVLLESASFDAKRIRRTARRVGLHSEASFRFERGVDPALAELASARAASLLARLGGGRLARGAVDVFPRPRTPPRIGLRMARLESLTGVAFTPAAATDALTRLDCDVSPNTDALLTVVPPTARADLAREVDLIEELLRVTGYDQVPSTLPPLRQSPAVLASRAPDRARETLAAAGLAEAITYGFQSIARLEALRLGALDRRNQPIALRNPMTVDQAIMRTSLLPNLLAAVARNASYGHRDVALFEVGTVFWRRAHINVDREPNELADEPVWVTGVLTGSRARHLGPATPWDFFDAKGLLERVVAAQRGGEIRVAATRAVTYLHPGVAAEVFLAGPDGVAIGTVGEVHPETRAAFGIEAPVFAFELQLDRLGEGSAAQMVPIPRFPGSTRDVSLLLAADLPAARVHEVVRAASQPLVEAVQVLEDYRDDRLGAGMKSMLWSIGYRSPERTLTDAEVDAAHEAIVARLVHELPAQRR